MRITLRPVAVLVAMACAFGAQAAEGPEIPAVRKERPRLFITTEDVTGLRQAVKSDEQIKRWHERLRGEAERMLGQKPVVRELIGPRLLDKSRTALGRISTLAGLYLIDGDKRFAERARQEMLAVAEFSDWNPSHFLDVAEMTNAVAIGYDWLYSYLSADERKTIREAIVKHGLKPGFTGFEKRAFWSRSNHNWGQVCAGGLTIGALAIADEEPEMAQRMIRLCVPAMESPMAAFADDGGFPEGPGYWNYATAYNVYYLAATESALGTDFGLKKKPGFDRTGYFRMYCVGPIGQTFNYADAGSGAGSAPQMFWLGRAFNRPEFVEHEIRMAGDRGNLFHLIWLYQYRKSKAATEKSSPWPVDMMFRNVDVAFFRSSWNDDALFVGFKGGNNRFNHSHLDLGSFVLDGSGHRWALDLGGDNYNLPGYFGGKRWTYYRLRTESHNTLTLDGENQATDGKAPMVAWLSTPKRAHAVVDLTSAYRQQAKSVRRGVAMLDRSAMLVQDEIEAAKPVEVTWNFLTAAKIKIDGKTATLSQGKAKLEMKILSPKDAEFKVISANPPPPQRQQPEVQNLTVKLPGKVSTARIVVLIAPAGAKVEAGEIKALGEWEGRK